MWGKSIRKKKERGVNKIKKGEQLYVETLRKRHKTNWKTTMSYGAIVLWKKRKSALSRNTSMLTSAKVIKLHDSRFLQ